MEELTGCEGRERAIWEGIHGMATPLPQLQIGSVQIGFPVVQAALSGYSDWPMRIIARRLGAPYAMCEVMLDQFLLARDNHRIVRRSLRITDDDHPLGGQLMGAEPKQVAAAAVTLADAGCDVVDINFACPVKKVLARRRGGYHLGQPEAASEIVGRVRDALPARIPVTVKMRRGIDHSSESRDRFFRVFDGAFQAGAAAITVHGRTVEQQYRGPSCWEFLGEVKRHAPRRTVLGSGDLFSAQDCLQMFRYSGVEGVTVARGAIGNPWIFAQSRALAAGLPLPPPPSLFEQRDVIGEHYRLAEETHHPKRCAALMRKFGIMYSALHPRRREVRNCFAQVKNRAGWEAVLARWYAEDLPGRYPARRIHCGQGEQAGVSSDE